MLLLHEMHTQPSTKRQMQMAKEIDLSSFEANTVSASASPVNVYTLQAQVHTQCNAQVESASSKEATRLMKLLKFWVSPSNRF
jgi:hypothetical protein